MRRAIILEKLTDILRQMGSVPEEKLAGLNEQSNLHTDLGLSSVGILYIVIAIEEAFEIHFDGVRMGDFTTVSQLVDFIEAKTAQSNGSCPPPAGAT